MARVLIVEDETFVRFLYREVLSKSFEIEEAENGFEAIELLESKKYDVVLMDINIPHFNGIDILKNMRQKNIKTNVIMISAYGMSEKKEKAFELGAVDYLVKPIDLDELKAKIEKWCSDDISKLNNQ